MDILRKTLKLSLKVIAIAAVVFLFFWVRANNGLKFNPRQFVQKAQEANVPEKSFPSPQNPKTVEFEWTYNKKEYVLNETLYRSIYDFYAAEPKEFSYQDVLPADWKEKYFGMFLQKNAGDDTIQKIAQDIKAAGEKNKLTDDQLVESVLSFVQAIPYDEAKAKEILSGNGSGLISYPYETLYEKSGVCSDKSFLTAALLRELGYGTALFVYEADNHMAVGIQCPVQYSSYGSGYCYAETTSTGNRIGMIPDLNTANNQAQAVKKIDYFNYSQADQFDVKKLGPVEIYQKTEGKTYEGIVQTLKISQNIESLGSAINAGGKELATLKKKLDSDQAVLDDLGNKLDKLAKKNDYEDYNKLVPEYNDLLKKVKGEIKTYNAKVDAYNQKVNSYNSLVANF